jgi:hypothetical protein
MIGGHYVKRNVKSYMLVAHSYILATWEAEIRRITV